MKARVRLGSFDELSAEDRISIAEAINEAGLSWNADAYLDEDDDELSLGQVGSARDADDISSGNG